MDTVAPNQDQLVTAETLYELVVTVKYVTFEQHPSMTAEMRLAGDLRRAYERYSDAHTKWRNSKYQTTLEQYRAAWKRKLGESNTFQGLPSSPSKLSIAQLLQEVIQVRKRRNNEHRNVKSHFNKVMESWSHLKALRQAQNYTTSRLSLDVYSLAPPADDRATWEADVQDELEELRHHSANLHEDYFINFLVIGEKQFTR